MTRAPASRCPACDRPLDAHTLVQTRDCLHELAKREPAYCRLTGPSDPQLWALAVARRR